MPSLDDLFQTNTRPRNRGRCAVCGAERTSRLTILVARLDKHAKAVQGQQRSTSAQLCDAHAADLWEAYNASLNATLRNGVPSSPGETPR